MGTKQHPAPNDCYARALPDEPMFTLLARDPMAPDLIDDWADRRVFDIQCGRRSIDDAAMVAEARQCAVAMREWRTANDGKWRLPHPVNGAAVVA